VTGGHAAVNVVVSLDYNPVVKIYTRTGDQGDTSLFDGTRIPKSDLRVEAYGDVDELSAVLGVVRASGVDADVGARLDQVQRDLFALAARLADPRGRIAARVEKVALTEGDAARLEGWIDEFEQELPALRHFILPGGCPAGAWLHLARTVCRRAERRMVALGAGAFDPRLLVYMNRLSDLLFVMARLVNTRAGAGEVEW
jgi:cob(I)alamin adenosyltransferase